MNVLRKHFSGWTVMIEVPEVKNSTPIVVVVLFLLLLVVLFEFLLLFFFPRKQILI